MMQPLWGMATLLALAVWMLLGAALCVGAGVAVSRRQPLPGALSAALGLGVLAAGGYGLVIMERAI